MDRESVCVVVVTYNSAPLLADLVTSLPDGFGDLPWQLVVVDNGSADGTLEELRRLVPDATVVSMGRNAGYAGGINAGVAAAAPHTAVLVLNPDVRLMPGCVPTLLTALRQPGVGIAVPRLVDATGALIWSMRREPTVVRLLADTFLGAERAGRVGELGEVVTDPHAYEHAGPTDWAEGSTQLVSAECWRRCGPWDASYFLYSEETDFGLRARDAGLGTCYVPTASAVHLEGDSGGSPSLWPLVVANRLRLYRRRHGPVRAAPFWLALMLREGSRALLGRRTAVAAVRTLLSPRRLRAPRGPEWLRG
jgi:N-acetylglucosaminyl-diphospho-decaprenol L-rhamnosyltransferase